jgi:hypothetical protein
VPSTLTVTNNLDSGPGSLRADIAAASSGDTIVFAPSLDGQTIRLTSGVLDINKNLTIQGPGASALAISGGYGVSATASRVFEAHASNVTIAGLSIIDGIAAAGAGISNSGGLTLSGCTLSHNRASFYGGAIYNNFGATLTVNDCTLSGNSAANGTGTGLGGAIYNDGTMSLLATTVTGNSTDGEAGGIFNDRQGDLTINKKSVVCNNFITGSQEVDLLNAGRVQISGSSEVCVIWKA